MDWTFENGQYHYSGRSFDTWAEFSRFRWGTNTIPDDLTVEDTSTDDKNILAKSEHFVIDRNEHDIHGSFTLFRWDKQARYFSGSEKLLNELVDLFIEAKVRMEKDKKCQVG